MKIFPNTDPDRTRHTPSRLLCLVLKSRCLLAGTATGTVGGWVTDGQPICCSVPFTARTVTSHLTKRRNTRSLKRTALDSQVTRHRFEQHNSHVCEEAVLCQSLNQPLKDRWVIGLFTLSWILGANSMPRPYPPSKE